MLNIDLSNCSSLNYWFVQSALIQRYLFLSLSLCVMVKKSDEAFSPVT